MMLLCMCQEGYLLSLCQPDPMKSCFHRRVPALQRLFVTMPHSEKNTTKNPTQLPTTPSAEYALVNISGTNSNRSLNTNPCTSEVYATSGTATAM